MQIAQSGLHELFYVLCSPPPPHRNLLLESTYSLLLSPSGALPHPISCVFAFAQVFNGIVGKGSFIQKIQHSDTLKNVFHEHAKNLNFEVVGGSR
eukprot:7999905-Pyramimonas_sp.AAC.1